MKQLTGYYLVFLSLLTMSCDSGELVEKRYSSGSLMTSYYVKETSDGSLLKNGSFESWYKNGQKESEGKYENGIRAGQWKTWHSNGQIESKGKYFTKWSEARKNGEWKYWYRDGQQSKKELHQEGFLKTETVWSEDGRLLRETGYFANGVKVGETTYQYNDNLSYTGKTVVYYGHRYISYKEYSIKIYDHKDELTQWTSHCDTKLCGHQRKWWWSKNEGRTGQLQFEFFVKNGELDSLCREWNRKGELLFEQNFEEGKNTSIAGTYKHQSDSISLYLGGNQAYQIQINTDIDASPLGQDLRGLDLVSPDIVEVKGSYFFRSMTMLNGVFKDRIDNLRLNDFGTYIFSKVTLDTLKVEKYSIPSGIDEEIILHKLGSSAIGYFYRQ